MGTSAACRNIKLYCRKSPVIITCSVVKHGSVVRKLIVTLVTMWEKRNGTNTFVSIMKLIKNTTIVIFLPKNGVGIGMTALGKLKW